MARFYSGKKFNTRGLFEEMRVAWDLNTMKPAKILGDNKFMMEFDSSDARRRVVEGGPWRHRGYALLVVEYDGFSLPSAIVMSSIVIWTRFYDLLDVLRKEDHASKLGARLGQVIKVDMNYPNYICVRVMFSLANALDASTKVHIRGRGDIVVPVQYENVPFFYFICGRIRHSDKECPDGEIGAGEFKFGVERPEATQFLNFKGAQCTNVQDEASSSQLSGQGQRHSGQMFNPGTPGDADGSIRSIPLDEERELMRGVKEIDVKDAGISQGLSPVFSTDGMQQRVSFGMNATSDEEMSTGVFDPYVAMQTRSVGDVMLGSYIVDYEMHWAKCSGPNRSGEKLKGERLSPYRWPKRKVIRSHKECTTEADAAREIKEEGVGMDDQVIGSPILALFPKDLKTLTGPWLGVRQEL
jgi:hypothetical protein